MGVGRTLAGNGLAVWGWGVCDCLCSYPCTWQLLEGRVVPSAPQPASWQPKNTCARLDVPACARSWPWLPGAAMTWTVGAPVLTVLVTLLLPPQVKEWLCLNCQMQRALGMDMTTAPRSKSQQQLHSPGLSPAHSPAKQPLGKPEQERARGPGGPQPGPRQAETARATSVPGPAPAAAPPEVGRVSPQPSLPIKPSTAEPRPPAGESPAKSATAAPSGPGAAEQTQEGLTGKLFGLGASLLTQASTLMSAQPEADSQGQPAPSKGPPKIVFSDASKEAGPRPPGSGPGPRPATGAKTEPGSGPRAQARTGGTTSPKHGRTEHQAASKAAAKPKTTPKERATCPLCQAELNVGSKGPANYNTCTTCKLQVCNLCGFNPTPHLVEVRAGPSRFPWALVRAEPGVMEGISQKGQQKAESGAVTGLSL